MKKRISIEWPGMTGLGPTAWDGDHQILKMHTPHHENDHQTKPADDGGKAPRHNGEKTPHKEE